MVKRDEKHRREIQVGRCRARGREREKEGTERSVEVEYDKTSIPLMETNPPLRAPSYDAPADNL